MSSNLDDVLALALPAIEVEIDHMLDRVGFDDFTPAELVVLAAALRPAYERHFPPSPKLVLLTTKSA